MTGGVAFQIAVVKTSFGNLDGLDAEDSGGNFDVFNRGELIVSSENQRFVDTSSIMCDVIHAGQEQALVSFVVMTV